MSVQDELDLEVAETQGLTEADVFAALHRHYGEVHGNGPRFAVAEHVRSRAGDYARRTADFVAMDLWRSRGCPIHGHEVKVSRNDWLRERKEPEKASEFMSYVNHWWLVVSRRSIVRDGELPPGWGLMAMRGSQLAVIEKAPRRDALLMPPERLAPLLRAVAKTAAAREAAKHLTSSDDKGGNP